MTPRGARGVLPLLLAGLACAWGSALAQAPSEESALAALLRECAREAAARAVAPAYLRVLPGDAHPLLRQVLAEELQRVPVALTGEEAEARCVLTLDAREMKSSTVPLGKSSYLRTVTVAVGAMVEDRQSRAVTWSREFTRQRADTLAGAAPYAERDYRLAERRSLFEALVVPVLATAAAVIIVVLFYSVRD
jgi:hypothetical protein